MTKKACILVVVLLMVSSLFVGCSSKNDTANVPQSGQKVIELKVHHHDPPNSIMGRFFTDWGKEIEEKTRGKVKLTIYHGASLGSPKDAYNLVTNGICDIAWGYVGLIPGKFPMSEVIGLPMLGIKDAKTSSYVIWDLFQTTDFLKKEYAQVQVLVLHGQPPVPIGAKKKIEKAVDLDGLKIRSPGGPPMEFLKLLGARPIGMPTVEIYEAMGKGVLDGYLLDPMGIDTWKLTEVTSYVLDAKTYSLPFFIVMNKAKWDSLPDDVKKVFNEVSGPAAIEKLAAEMDAVFAKVEKDITAKNGAKYPLSDIEEQKWKEIAKTVWEKWVDDMTAKGYPAKEVLMKTQELIQKYNK